MAEAVRLVEPDGPGVDRLDVQHDVAAGELALELAECLVLLVADPRRREAEVLGNLKREVEGTLGVENT